MQAISAGLTPARLLSRLFPVIHVHQTHPAVFASSSTFRNFLVLNFALLCLLVSPHLDLVAMAKETNSPAVQLLNSQRPLVIAHRGYSSLAPENTLPAFERALSAGADLTELDYHTTKDNVMVVIHDYTLDRTTDATQRYGRKNIKIKDQTYAEIEDLEAGLWYRPPFPGIRLPTLEQSLDVIQKGSVTLIERKAGEAKGCVELIEKRGMLNQVVVQAFDWDYLRDYHKLEPRQILGALGPPGRKDGARMTEEEAALSAAWLDEIKSVGASVAVWNRQVTATSVKAAHARGLKVWVYTIDDEATARKLLDAGVDGIITNNPALLWKVLATR